MFQTVIPNHAQPIITTKGLLKFKSSNKCIFRLYNNEGMNEDLLKSLLGYSGFLHIRKHPKKQKVDHKIVIVWHVISSRIWLKGCLFAVLINGQCMSNYVVLNNSERNVNNTLGTHTHLLITFLPWIIFSYLR